MTYYYASTDENGRALRWNTSDKFTIQWPDEEPQQVTFSTLDTMTDDQLAGLVPPVYRDALAADPMPDGHRVTDSYVGVIGGLPKWVNVTEEIPPQAAADIVLTPTQFHTALRVNGLDAAVKTAIAAMTDPVARASAEVRLEYASSYHRTDPLVAALAGALGLTDAQIDAMWIAAKDYP